MSKKIPIIDEQDLQKLIEQAIKNDGVLTSPTEISDMLINIAGVSITSTPRKDGRYQGYVSDKNQKVYVYGYTKDEVAIKIRDILKNGMPKKKKKASTKAVPTSFNAFAIYYFETFRIRKVAEDTYRADLSRYNKHLRSYFGEKALKTITPADCQKLLDSITSQGKGKTADEIYNLLSVIFKTAIKHGIINRNPLDIVYHERHEKQSGKALTKDEETRLKMALNGSEWESLFMLALYTGLRPNELESATVDGKFIVAVNSKRKHKRIEYKKIPIIKALTPYATLGFPKPPRLEVLRIIFKKILPNHKLYDLRTTFYSRCKEFGVSEYAISEFVGHSLGALGNAYTDLSDEYLLKEGEKLNEWV